MGPDYTGEFREEKQIFLLVCCLDRVPWQSGA